MTRQENSESVLLPVLLPGLPDEVALLCLARLPLRVQARCRCVSRAFLHYLHPQARRELGVRETWVLLATTVDSVEEWIMNLGGVRCLLLDPLHGRCDTLPMPSDWPSDLYAVSLQALPLASQQGRVLLHGLEYKQTGNNSSVASLFDLIGLDVLRRQWCPPAPRMMQCDRFGFAWANLDGYLYIAGGRHERMYSQPYSTAEMMFSQPYSTAERFNMVSEQWEWLPDMKEKRHACSGFAMDSCFYVVGGLSSDGNPLFSGEFFDPKTGVWTLLPEMWPLHIANPQWVLEPPAVAMVNDHLYALKRLSSEIFWYDRQAGQWVSLGDFSNEWEPAEGQQLLSMLDELWILSTNHEGSIRVISCKPQGAGSTLKWQKLPLQVGKHPMYDRIIACLSIQV